MGINEVVVAIGTACAAVVAIGGAASVIKKWVSPIMTMADSIHKLKERISALEENQCDTREGIGVLCRCLLSLLDNAVTGNSIENIKGARKEMQEYLIKRTGSERAQWNRK